MKKVNDKDYEGIIPTATTTLYPLIFTDIPYVQETFSFLESRKKTEYLPEKVLAVELEARYKLTDKFLVEEAITQVIELASGFLSRGLEFCKRNQKAKYLELDLPQVMQLKTECFKDWLWQNNIKNLKFVAGNALNAYSFCNKRYIGFDQQEKVAVINQGLLRYLTFEEKSIVAENVKKILQKHGGVWITGDFTPAKFIKNQNANLKDFNKSISELTDRNNLPRFKDLGHVKNWLDERGFTVEIHEFAEAIPLLTSPQNLSIPKEKVEELLAHAIICVIRLK